MNARAVSMSREGAPLLSDRRALLTAALDLVRLCKPRVTVMVIVTALGGMWLATRLGGATVTLGGAAAALVGITLIVGSANALNMYLERDVDALMVRTKDRPLPSGRMAPAIALVFGLLLAAVSVPLLFWQAGALTGSLAAASLVLYVLVYTPLKRRSPIALLVGAIPGAAPPLLGWTAATGRLDALGLGLFAVLFFWQLPHFLAIATFRQSEYERAGIAVLPAVRGPRVTRVQAVVFTVCLLLSSLALVPLGVRGPVYTTNAIALGGLFLVVTLGALTPSRGADAPTMHERWARSVFAVSLLYLPLMVAAMMVSA